MRNIGYLVIVWLIIFPSTGLAQDSIQDASIDSLPPQFSLFEKQLFIENQKLRNASETWYKGIWTPAFLSVLVAFVGVYVTRQFNNKQIENRRWELIQSSFNWLAGRTQNRNIGIAVAEHFWEKESEYRKTWLRLFANQAVYLLADQFDRKAQDHKRNPDEVLQRLDEELTLQRIMEKIVANKEDIGHLQCQYLLLAIDKRLSDVKKYTLSDESNRINKDKLLTWKKDLA